MSSKRLYTSREDKMVCVVCGGIAEDFDVDPTLVRLGAVLLGCSGTGILVYIVAAVIIPERRY